jgi:hypothetical protein
MFEFWRSLGGTDVVVQVIVIGLVVLFATVLVRASEAAGPGSDHSKPDPMKGKRKVYDKDGKVIGYFDEP